MSAPADRVTGALQRAGALCELRRFPEAAALLRETIAGEPQRHEAWSWLAAAELGAGNHQPALGAAERAIALDPDAEWPRRLASTALRLLGRIEESVGHAREAVRLDPGGWYTHTTLARSLAKHGPDLPEALAAAERAVALGPDRAEAHITAGVVAATAGDRAAAETAFRRALAIDPQSGVAHSELARLRMGGGRRANPTGLAEAATGFARSIAVDPHTASARRNLELVLRVFLAKMSYFIFIDAYLVARIGSSSGQPLARLLPIALFAIPAGYAWRFLARLSGNLREYLLRLPLQDGKIGLAVALEVLAVACLLAGALVPQSSRTGLAGGAAAAALVGRVVLWTQVEHSSRVARGLQPRPAFGTPAMWIVAAALILTAAFLALATATSKAGPGGVVAAGACAAASVAIVRRIKRRRLAADRLDTQAL
jgi:tetratricopeptide (TPR) repeat protein